MRGYVCVCVCNWQLLLEVPFVDTTCDGVQSLAGPIKLLLAVVHGYFCLHLTNLSSITFFFFLIRFVFYFFFLFSSIGYLHISIKMEPAREASRLLSCCQAPHGDAVSCQHWPRPCARAPSCPSMCWVCGMGSPNRNWAGNSLSSCRGCKRKRKNLLVSISLVSDGRIGFLTHKKTLHPEKSPSVESCCVLDPPGVQLHPVSLVNFVRLGAGRKRLESRGHFPTAEVWASQGCPVFAELLRLFGLKCRAKSALCSVIPKLAHGKQDICI